MRNVISSQLQIGQVDIAKIAIDVTSRDDIPLILLGLQHIYTDPDLRKSVFKILENIIPVKRTKDNVSPINVASDKGRPGMEQWTILVLATLRLGMRTDFDRVLELANQHQILRIMLRHSPFYNKNYRLQTLKDNLKLFMPDIMNRINTEASRMR